MSREPATTRQSLNGSEGLRYRRNDCRRWSRVTPNALRSASRQRPPNARSVSVDRTVHQQGRTGERPRRQLTTLDRRCTTRPSSATTVLCRVVRHGSLRHRSPPIRSSEISWSLTLMKSLNTSITNFVSRSSMENESPWRRSQRLPERHIQHRRACSDRAMSHEAAERAR